ncbi:MAG: carboxylate--amine ligase [Candidatus Scalindua sp. AMX11]|nr:MAG: carboxylate--amine ligase [Candidatus Scalindua sp.]NOG83490.1 carboxylate--amine ligase [Planctomycetota bacterium]RZV72895.1 MAG: carboxylate--amine ligase [Candidatus Scalindua sp. SCAELEC01]TDE64814.1 MAG: carboxylate--amine ligase [Candidatus Scalindua sp. AMX11]GJQ59811.1 MAG: hypothetical protein SCALA701_26120 [Candidatus Scalindua sp.]
MRENNIASAIVVGMDDLRGVYVARTLAQYGIYVIGIAKDRNSVGCKTNACKEIYIADTMNVDFIETLTSIGPKLKEKAVLFPCMDRSVLMISQHRNKLKEFYHVLLPDHDTVEILMDKVRFYQYADKHGILIPKTVFVEKREDLEYALSILQFPYVVKPPSSKLPQWVQKTYIKAFKVSHRSELYDVFENYSSLVDSLIVQEWIEGTDSNLYSCNCYFNRDSQPVASFVSKKIRQWPPRTGETCLGQECHNDTVLQESIRLFKTVNFQGLGYVEFKQDPRTGQYYILEPNIGRPTARSAIAEASGVELLYSVYCDAVNKPLPCNLKKRVSGIKWVYLRKDFMSSIHYWRRGDLSLIQWINSYRGKKIFALFSITDPVPFLSDLLRVVKIFFNRKEKAKRKSP